MKKLLLMLSLVGVVGLEALTATQAMKIHKVKVEKPIPNLDLRNMGITEIDLPFLAFVANNSVNVFDLSYNKIQNIPQKVVEKMNDIIYNGVGGFDLMGNPLNQDTQRCLNKQPYLESCTFPGNSNQ